MFPSLADLLLGTADEYRFLSGGSIPVPGQSDSENFTQTMDSMAIMGFNPEELLCKTRQCEKRGSSLFYVYSIWSLLKIIFSVHCLTLPQPCWRWSLRCSSLETFPSWKRRTRTRPPCLITQLLRNCAIFWASMCWSSLGPSSLPGLKWVENMCRKPRLKNR